MHMVVMDKISFANLVAHYNQTCTSLLPRFVLERKWRACLPADRKFATINMWFSTWMALGANVGNLTEDQMIEQFDAAILRQHSKIIQLIHESELAGHRLTLQ